MPDAAPAPRSRWEIAGLVAFGLLLLGVSVRLGFASDLRRQNVYLKVFAHAGEAFAAGQPLYELEHGFRYPPVAAAAFVPFTWFGPLLGSIVWRCTSAAVLFLAALATLRAGFPRPYTSRERGAWWLLLVPAMIGSVNNGQPNPVVLGLLLWGTLAAWRGHLQRSGAMVAVTAALKVYPLAHGLLLAALRPRLLVGLCGGVALAALLPYALQTPEYVSGQYRALVELLRTEDRTTDFANAYRDLRLLLIAVGLPLPNGWFLPLQAASGAALAALCLWLQSRRIDTARLFAGALALVLCWFMLCGPATESVTYCWLTPALIWPLLDARRDGPRWRWRTWLALNALYLLEHLLPTPSREFQAAHVWSRCLLPTLALAAIVLWSGELVALGRRTAPR